MTTHTHKMKAIVMALVLLMTTLNARLKAQSDTLHLHYLGTQIQLHDTSVARIEHWAKSLNGKHVDIEVLAYFHKSEFKKFASQRADELFLELNRKARSLITITFIGPRKGADSQRSMVDVVYRPSVSPEEAAAAKARTEAQEAAEKKKKEEEKMAEKESKKKERESAEKKDESLSKKEKDKHPKAQTDPEKNDDISDRPEKNKNKNSKKDNKAPSGQPVEDSGEIASNKDTETVQDSNTKKKKRKKEEPAPPVVKEKTDIYTGVEYKEHTQGNNGDPGTRRSEKGMKIKQSQVQKIKAARIIIPRTDRPVIDSIVMLAVKKFWTFNPNIEYGTMSYLDALKLTKKEKNVLVLTMVRSTSSSAGRDYYYISQGHSLVLENRKSKVQLTIPFPTYTSKDLINLPSVSFAVCHMNSMLSNLDKHGLRSSRIFLNEVFKQNHPLLKETTLLIPGGLLHEKVDPRDIPALYDGDFSIVDYPTWSEAILGKKKGLAYVTVAPYPINGKYHYCHFLMDAGTGEVLYIEKPATSFILGENISAGNTGYIAAKNIKSYNRGYKREFPVEEPQENRKKDPPAAKKEKRKASDQEE